MKRYLKVSKKCCLNTSIMHEVITSINQLDSHNNYPGVMIYIYSETMDILENMKDKLLQIDEKCTAAFSTRKYYENRPMLIIEGDFSSEQLRDIYDYLNGQNVSFSSVNETGLISISSKITNLKNNRMPGKELIPDKLEDVVLKDAMD